MLRFSLSVAVRQIAGVGLLAVLVWRRVTDTVHDDTGWWAGFIVGTALIAPEVLQELVKAWKTWRGSDGA